MPIEDRDAPKPPYEFVTTDLVRVRNLLNTCKAGGRKPSGTWSHGEVYALDGRAYVFSQKADPSGPPQACIVYDWSVWCEVTRGDSYDWKPAQ